MIGMSSPFLLHYFFSDVNIQNGVLKMKIFITHIWNSLKSLFVHGGGLVVRRRGFAIIYFLIICVNTGEFDSVSQPRLSSRCDGIVLVAEASIEL
jgi:hypothetical protein